MLKKIASTSKLTAAFVAISMSLAGCNAGEVNTSTSSPEANPAAADSNSRPQVMATNSIVCDLTKQIAANTVNVTCLIEPGTDPHLYEPKPSDRKAIESAKIIFYSGYDFEPGLTKLILAAQNPAPKIAVAEAAVPNPQKFEEDGKTVTDPHVWHNAQNGINMVGVISSNLAKIAPNNAEKYTANAQKVKGELTQIDNWIKSQIATIPPNQRKLVTTHDAFGYYVKAYDLAFEGALGGISTEEKPTAARVKELVKDIKQTNVPTIFAETTINPRLIEAVAKEANVKVSERELYADGLGENGTEGSSYQKMLKANTRTIVEGLGGKYTASNN